MCVYTHIYIYTQYTKAYTILPAKLEIACCCVVPQIPPTFRSSHLQPSHSVDRACSRSIERNRMVQYPDSMIHVPRNQCRSPFRIGRIEYYEGCWQRYVCTLCARTVATLFTFKTPFSALKNKRLFFARWYLIGIVPMMGGGREGGDGNNTCNVLIVGFSEYQSRGDDGVIRRESTHFQGHGE